MLTDEAAITVKRLPSGYWHIRGQGPCNFAQVVQWPCSEAELRSQAFPEASDAFIHDAMRSLEEPTDAD